MVERYRDRVRRSERVLSNLRDGMLATEPPEYQDRRFLEELEVANRRVDLQRFTRLVRAIGRRRLGDAAAIALRFRHPWDRVRALEEVVLVGEARTVGLEAADGRRREWRREVLDALTDRLLDTVPRR